MQISKVVIKNFRGVKSASIILPKHAVLIGDNNTGKTTLLEAIDLVLGPDRLNRLPPIDEHDFYQSKYRTGSAIENPDTEGEPGVDDEDEFVDEDEFEEEDELVEDDELEAEAGEAPRIYVEVTIIDLNEEQIARFGDYLEFWDKQTDTLYTEEDLNGLDEEHITEALRVAFIGQYEIEDDDFTGKTYYARSLTESDRPSKFSKRDKQYCGFLYLRSLRTGRRALSLERGSLLDIILRLKEVRPQMWEDTICELASHNVACAPEQGVSSILVSINEALKKYVPKEWGIEPQLKVSNLTREHLRQVITAFIATGESDHLAPYYRQGTGTLNMLVLAMLSQIAEDKQNVIFGMEEPETAMPPYAQKRIIHQIKALSSQTLFTSHSPYVIEEFPMDDTVVLKRNEWGILSRYRISLPDSVKAKRYRQEFRTRFCEGLLARRIMIAEGATEAAAFPVVCRRLSELNPDVYVSLEALGICTVDAGGESNIHDLAQLYGNLGKQIFVICDKQTDEQKENIEEVVDELFMHKEKGFENLVLKNTTSRALKRFSQMIEWPENLLEKYPDPEEEPQKALLAYFKKKKAEWGIADYLAQCREREIPSWIKDACKKLRDICEPPPPDDDDELNESPEDID